MLVPLIVFPRRPAATVFETRGDAVAQGCELIPCVPIVMCGKIVVGNMFLRSWRKQKGYENEQEG